MNFGSRRGVSTCPRLVPGQGTLVRVDTATSTSLAFSVANIPERLTEQPWSCEFGLRDLPDSNPSVLALLDPNTATLITSSSTSSHTKTISSASPLSSSLSSSDLQHQSTSSVSKPSGDLHSANPETAESPESADKLSQSSGRVVLSTIESPKGGKADVSTLRHSLMDFPTSSYNNNRVVLQAFFQGTVVTLAEGVRVGVGSIVCRGSLSSFDPSSSSPQHHSPPRGRVSMAQPRLVAVDGAVLDNPEQVTVLAYQCSFLATNCTSCTSLFSPASDTVTGAPPCGWCTSASSCTGRTQCITGHWLLSKGLAVDGRLSPNDQCQTLDQPRARHAHHLSEDTESGGHRHRGVSSSSGKDGEEEEEDLDYRDESQDVNAADSDGFHILTEDGAGEDHPHGLGALDELHQVTGDDASTSLDDDDSAIGYRSGSGTKNQGQNRRGSSKGRNNKKKNRKNRTRGEGGSSDSGGEEEEAEEAAPELVLNERRGKGRSRARSGGRGSGRIRVAKGRYFLKLPFHPEVYVARDTWRLHTGRQYYVPVSKKMFVNLGFVRQAVYGSLGSEKSRTVLVDGAWKKATGFYLDLYEKTDQEPVTSVVTSSKAVFDALLAQLEGDQQ